MTGHYADNPATPAGEGAGDLHVIIGQAGEDLHYGVSLSGAEDVDNDGLLRQLAHVLQLADVDLANPGFDALEELPERGHDLLRIPTPGPTYSRERTT